MIYYASFGSDKNKMHASMSYLTDRLPGMSNIPIKQEYIPNNKSPKGKNILDFYLQRDILDFAIRNPDVSSFLVISGDSDFKGVLDVIKQHGYNVKILAPPGGISNKLSNHRISRKNIRKYTAA